MICILLRFSIREILEVQVYFISSHLLRNVTSVVLSSPLQTNALVIPISIHLCHTVVYL